MEVTPIGQNFRLIDGRQGRRRWLLQIPKTTPISTTRQSLQDSESNVPPELTGEKSAEATDQVDASPDGQNTTRCSYVIANVDMDQASHRDLKDSQATSCIVLQIAAYTSLLGCVSLEIKTWPIVLINAQCFPKCLPSFQICRQRLDVS